MKYKLLIKPAIFKFLGPLYNSAQVIYPYIVIPEYLSKKLKESDTQSASILEHEKFHFKRIKDRGVFKWYVEYIFNKGFRLEEEVLAYKRQCEVLARDNLPFDVDKYSKILSSWIYLKMVDSTKARELLNFKDK